MIVCSLRRVVFKINLVDLRYDFFVVVVTARRANVVWALQLTTVGALVWVRGSKRIVCAAVVAA